LEDLDNRLLRALAGVDRLRFVERDWLLGHFGSDLFESQRRYLAFVETGLPETRPEAA